MEGRRAVDGLAGALRVRALDNILGNAKGSVLVSEFLASSVRKLPAAE